MIEFIRWHPSHKTFWGDNFKVGYCSKYDNKNFLVENRYNLGNFFQFSYYKCNPNLTLAMVKRFDTLKAFRNAIYPQTQEYLKINELEDGKYLCEITGEILERSEIHIDHHFQVITFLKLVEQFLEINNLTYDDITLIYTDDGMILNNEHRRMWGKYHQETAILRLIKKTYNLSGKE